MSELQSDKVLHAIADAIPVGQAEASDWVRAYEARQTVNEAAGAARLVGGVFIVLGVVLVVPAFVARMRGGVEFLAVANAVILIGPGVWYFFAAAMLRKLDRRAPTVALRVAAGQGAAVALGLLAAALLPRQRELGHVATPAGMALFFMPALAALAYHLRRARNAINALGGGEIGFEPLAPRPVIPVAPEERDVAAGPGVGGELRE